MRSVFMAVPSNTTSVRCHRPCLVKVTRITEWLIAITVPRSTYCADRMAQAAQFVANVPPINVAIGTVSNVASRLCDEAKPGQILISPRVLTKVENAVKVRQVSLR
jgi:hypothetical protein